MGGSRIKGPGIKHFQVGDWIYSDSDIPVRVEIVRRTYLCYSPDGGVTFEYVFQPSPIPITPEIMKKNGFESKYDATSTLHDMIFNLTDGTYLDVGNGDVFATYSEYDSDMSRWVENELLFCAISYVHELQHLLQLLKINKDIKI